MSNENLVDFWARRAEHDNARALAYYGRHRVIRVLKPRAKVLKAELERVFGAQISIETDDGRVGEPYVAAFPECVSIYSRTDGFEGRALDFGSCPDYAVAALYHRMTLGLGRGRWIRRWNADQDGFTAYGYDAQMRAFYTRDAAVVLPFMGAASGRGVSSDAGRAGVAPLSPHP